MTEQARTITLDGIAYDIAQFSEGVQQAVSIYNAIQADLGKHQLEVIKCQAALQNVGAQISGAVKKELEEKKAAAEAAPAA
jgi:hypothetical protein